MKVCIIGSYIKALVMTADRIPLTGETLIGYDYRGTFGGKGSDMAVQAARLGAEVVYIGVGADDLFGQEFIDLMKREKVDITGLRITDEEATGIGFIVKDKQAKNIIVITPGANKLFNREDIDRASHLIEDSDVVLAQLEIPIDTALYAMKKGKEAGKLTILNPAPAMDLSSYDLSCVDILTPNETEARVAAGIPVQSAVSDQDAADILLTTGCQSVVMTLGDKGAKVFTKEGAYGVESYFVDVVDSNGAGDCFNASLATALAAGKTVKEGGILCQCSRSLMLYQMGTGSFLSHGRTSRRIYKKYENESREIIR